MKVHAGVLTITIPLVGLSPDAVKRNADYYTKNLTNMGSLSDNGVETSLVMTTVEVNPSEVTK